MIRVPFLHHWPVIIPLVYDDIDYISLRAIYLA